jgi:hypothetical protein
LILNPKGQSIQYNEGEYLSIADITDILSAGLVLSWALLNENLKKLQ